ncbi:ATP-grasp domain-containing protein [Kitasatospora sp. NPDC048540]|uniref:ATP-grasp domain-containing protein n=1 Tax=unclassified Kitasatospora TaxID=2633591 RepID=UPI00068B7E5D|nr:ATP-grasp domain-containing protein [Kitasatospora sp. MBT63]
MTDRLLLLAPRVNETGLQLLTAARRRGLRAHTATRWAVPEELRGLRPAHLYGGPLFADAVGAELGIGALEDPAGWLPSLPYGLTGRRVTLGTLAGARRSAGPAFVKPPGDKLFAARVYEGGAGLPAPGTLPEDLPVLVSEVVSFEREYRLFVLDGEVRTGSRYQSGGRLDVVPLEDDPDRAEVLAFTAEVLACGGLPSAVAVDVGRLDSGRWAVVEANSAWASGGYGCDPDAVLDVVLRAAGPATDVPPADRPHLRPLPAVVR